MKIDSMLTRANAKTFLKLIKTQLREAYWDVYGRSIPKPVLPKQARSFFFICKGNVCRSPFAERFARRYASDKSLVFHSAGIDVSHANPPPPAALAAAEQFGVSMHDHRSRPLTSEVMQKADAVFAMEMSQLHQLQKRYPEASNMIFALALFEPQNTTPIRGYEKYNIHDPYGGSIEAFSRCYHRISRCLGSITQLTQS